MYIVRLHVQSDSVVFLFLIFTVTRNSTYEQLCLAYQVYCHIETGC